MLEKQRQMGEQGYWESVRGYLQQVLVLMVHLVLEH
jgi:hypothetical protein